MAKKTGNSIFNKFSGNKAKNGLINSAKKIAAKAKKVAQRVAKITKNLIQIVVKLAGAIVSPNFWLVILLVAIVIFTISFFKVFGPIDIQEMCTSEGVPMLDELDGEEKEGAFVAYLTERGISKEAAIFVASIANEHKGDFSKSKGIPEDCDKECIEDIIDDEDKLSQVEIGPYRLKGEDAKTLLTNAIETNKDWGKPELQLPIILNILKEASYKDGSQIRETDKSSNTKIIRELSDLFGVKISGKDLSIASTNINKKKNNLDEVSCVSMGTGKGRGRLDGGLATDVSGGPLADFAGLDMSNMINFMDSFVNTTRVKPPIEGYDEKGNPIYSYGPGNANARYIAAKEQAEKNGGRDKDGPNVYASCDRFVATVMKAMEIDVNFKWGNAAGQIDYMKGHKCWQEVDKTNPQNGDVIGWYPKPGSPCGRHGHIAIYANGMVYEASYRDTYPVKSRGVGRTSKPDSCGRVPHLFRWNQTVPGCERKVKNNTGSTPGGLN